MRTKGKKRKGNIFKEYFTLVELSRAFGYKNPNSYYSSNGRPLFDEGIGFVVERVCEVKDAEIARLRRMVAASLGEGEKSEQGGGGV
jgi:hypothetical protein